MGCISDTMLVGQRVGSQKTMAYILEGQFLQMWGLGDIITDEV